MRIINQSRKIIGINGEPLLPGSAMTLPEGFETHPAIVDYIKKGIVVDAENLGRETAGSGISDLDRERIAREAVAEYKKAQEAETAAAQAVKEAEIKAVKAMKKPELLTKAAGMGLSVGDDDTADVLKEKIMAALGR